MCAEQGPTGIHKGMETLGAEGRLRSTGGKSKATGTGGRQWETRVLTLRKEVGERERWTYGWEVGERAML